MVVTTERLPRSLVSLQIEVEPERVEASMEKAAKRVASQVRIPGFRPGKAPRAIVERTVGRPALLQEALEDLLPDLYNEVIDSEEIDPIDQPEFDLKSIEPLVVRATVPVRPTIDLNDYASLRAPKPEPEADRRADRGDVDQPAPPLRDPGARRPRGRVGRHRPRRRDGAGRGPERSRTRRKARSSALGATRSSRFRASSSS